MTDLACPIPATPNGLIEIAHGGGGRMMHRLIKDVLLPALGAATNAVLHDAAVLDIDGARLAFTTDSYVVRPLVFPGGDIGSLAVNGTVNDLAMAGARPVFLSIGLVLEEGLSIALLERVMASMRRAAEAANVRLVTGDTKVVERGKGDALYVNTSGIGVVSGERSPHPRYARPGDAVLLSGDVGCHGIAVLAAREGFAFEGAIASDNAPLASTVLRLLDAGIDLHCLRDPTRGGVATALVEIAEAAGIMIRIDEAAVPVSDTVRGACELLGLDPLYVASEGRFVAFVPTAQAERALGLMRDGPGGSAAAVIGQVEAADRGTVHCRGPIGGVRVLDMPSGEQLPRIC